MASRKKPYHLSDTNNDGMPPTEPPRKARKVEEPKTETATVTIMMSNVYSMYPMSVDSSQCSASHSSAIAFLEGTGLNAPLHYSRCKICNWYLINQNDKCICCGDYENGSPMSPLYGPSDVFEDSAQQLSNDNCGAGKCSSPVSATNSPSYDQEASAYEFSEGFTSVFYDSDDDDKKESPMSPSYRPNDVVKANTQQLSNGNCGGDECSSPVKVTNSPTHKHHVDKDGISERSSPAEIITISDSEDSYENNVSSTWPSKSISPSEVINAFRACLRTMNVPIYDSDDDEKNESPVSPSYGPSDVVENQAFSDSTGVVHKTAQNFDSKDACKSVFGSHVNTYSAVISKVETSDVSSSENVSDSPSGMTDGYRADFNTSDSEQDDSWKARKKLIRKKLCVICKKEYLYSTKSGCHHCLVQKLRDSKEIFGSREVVVSSNGITDGNRVDSTTSKSVENISVDVNAELEHICRGTGILCVICDVEICLGCHTCNFEIHKQDPDEDGFGENVSPSTDGIGDHLLDSAMSATSPTSPVSSAVVFKSEPPMSPTTPGSGPSDLNQLNPSVGGEIVPYSAVPLAISSRLSESRYYEGIQNVGIGDHLLDSAMSATSPTSPVSNAVVFKSEPPMSPTTPGSGPSDLNQLNPSVGGEIVPYSAVPPAISAPLSESLHGGPPRNEGFQGFPMVAPQIAMYQYWPMPPMNVMHPPIPMTVMPMMVPMVPMFPPLGYPHVFYNPGSGSLVPYGWPMFGYPHIGFGVATTNGSHPEQHSPQ